MSTKILYLRCQINLDFYNTLKIDCMLLKSFLFKALIKKSSL